MIMADQARWVARTVQQLLRQGWDYRRDGAHVMVYPADKSKKPFPISITPSGRYGQVNAIRQIRKAGGRV